jgi:integrase
LRPTEGTTTKSSCIFDPLNTSTLMGEVNFYLKKAEETTGLSLIYLQFKYKGNRLVFSFGQSISPKNWNAAKQRVKSNKQTTADGEHSLNDLLKNLQEVCEVAYKNELKNGIPAPETLRAYLVKFLNQNTSRPKDEKQTLFKLLDRFISGEIKISRGERRKIGRSRAKGTIISYSAIKRHLSDFEIHQRYRVDFDTINKDFFNKYVTFLSNHLWKVSWKNENGKKVKKIIAVKQPGKGLSNNSIAKDIKKLKVVLNEAVELGYTNNQEFRKGYFGFSEDETDSVYLSDQELIKLSRHDFSYNKTLEQVCDLFVFNSFVGLRYNDVISLGPENIVSIDGDLFIKSTAKKTNELVIIPCNPIVLKIFQKYETNPNRLPKAYKNQVFNRYIKEVCKAAGLNEKGRLSSDLKKELWECVSSHTSRRSFATNLYLDGYPVNEIKKATGHKSEKAFWKYIRVSKLDSAKRLSKHQKANWSEKMLQVERSVA